jgi:hypothetical protein
MERDAIVSPFTLGVIEAYRTVIIDISKVLEDPVIDMRNLFYAVMIQSGIERFRLPERHTGELPNSSLVSDRIGTVDLARVEPQLLELRSLVRRSVKAPPLSQMEKLVVNHLEYFLSDLYIAAEFCRPVATGAHQPRLVDLQKVFKDDLCVVLQSLFRVVEYLNLDAPVARFQVPVHDLKSFRTVMSSDVFQPYVDSHALLEVASRPRGQLIDRVSETARRVIGTFPGSFELRKTVVGAVQAMPAIVEATAGKIFGAFAKPLFSALAGALTRDQRVLVYSFDPTWRQVWGGKLDKVRAALKEEENASGTNPAAIAPD